MTIFSISLCYFINYVAPTGYDKEIFIKVITMATMTKPRLQIELISILDNKKINKKVILRVMHNGSKEEILHHKCLCVCIK